MNIKKVSIYRPSYKKFLSFKIDIKKQKKILKFNKQKWKKKQKQFLKLNRKNSRNCYYKFYDNYSHHIPNFSNKFSNNFKRNIKNNLLFRLQYGYLSFKYVKKLVNLSYLKSKSSGMRSNVKYFFIEFLERRLDIMLVRTHFAVSVRNARQMISHGNVKVNNIVVHCNSFLLQKGDKITFKKELHELIECRMLEATFWPFSPNYTQISYKIFQICIVEDIKHSNICNNLTVWLDWNSIRQIYL